MNRLLRKVKKLRTIKRNYLPEGITVFRRTLHGYKQDGSVSSNIIRDYDYEVYIGKFYVYQQPLKENESVELIDPKQYS